MAGDLTILFDECAARGGGAIGVATLNSPATLNALSTDMALALHRQLGRWAVREDIVVVLLRGAGERAFCAGGDIQDLHRAMAKNHAAGGWVDDGPDRFFEAEYRVDYSVHRFPKPIVAFGRGFVMGGGLGLFSASSVRLVTPTTRIAMPEVSIGLFPDAGATWILRNLPMPVGLFMGATGCRIGAADALHLSLATHVVAADCDPLAALVEAGGNPAAAFGGLALTVAEGDLAALEPVLRERIEAIPADARAAREMLGALVGAGEFADRALATSRDGCPTSIGIVCEQLRRAPALTLEDCFRLEMTLAGNCARFADFAEGVRARIIDKDGAPRWRAGDQDHVLAHFEAPWPTNPLADLGRH